MEVKLEELEKRDGETILEVLGISKEQANEAVKEAMRRYQTPSNYFKQMKIDEDTIVEEMAEAISNGVNSYSIITARILLKQRETVELPDFIILWVLVKNFIEEHKHLFSILRYLKSGK